VILAGGTVHTPDEKHDSIAIDGARIAARAAGPVIDLGGRCVVPGFTDAHTHFPTWALMQRKVRLEGCRSLDEALERVRAAAEGADPDRWLLGYGWRAAGWTPTAAALDSVVGDLPTALWAKDYHALWLSSAAIARAGASCDGVLNESAAWRFRERHIPPATEEYADAIAAAVPIAHSRGVTAIHDKDGWLGAPGLFQKVRADHGLTLRVWQSVPHERLDALEALGLEAGLGDEFLRVGYLKVFMDGTLGSGTARMLDGGGVQITSREELEHIVARAARSGWPVAVHAIGDRANRDALDAFAATRRLWEPRGLRQRIEHAQHLHPSDVRRFGELGVAVSVQFSHAPADRELVDARVDPRRVMTYAFRSLWDAGALVVNGSDAPIEELDPLAGIVAATRRTLDDREPWQPEEALTVEQALRASTVNAARLSGDADRRGTLTPGQAADLVVLDRDPLASTPGEIQVVATMVAGRWVHGAPPWASDRLGSRPGPRRE
jgi:predicted amidohydrolase YtcJ